MSNEKKYISIQKLNGGFIIEYNDETSDHRKIVRKLSEVVALVKTQLAEPTIVTSGGIEIDSNV